jgi:hypothetical protein
MEEQIKKKYGAWKKQTQKGEVINFAIEGQKYTMWVNTYKKKDSEPDYQIYENNYVKPDEVKPIINDDLEF